MKKFLIVLLITSLISVCAWADDTAAKQASTQQNAWSKQMTACGVSLEDTAKIRNHFQKRNMVRAYNIIQADKQHNIPIGPIVDRLWRESPRMFRMKELLEQWNMCVTATQLLRLKRSR